MTFTQCWCHYTETAKETGTSKANYTESMNLLFANCSKENSIYPLKTREIVESQSKDTQLVALTTQDGYSTKLVENIKVLCKDASSSLLRTSKIERLLGIITTYSIRDQRISKRLFVVRCIGRVCNIPSDHMSKSVTVAR